MRFLVNCHPRKYSQRIRSPDPNQAADSGAIMFWKWNRHLCLLQVFWELMGFLPTGLYPLWVLEKVSPRNSFRYFYIFVNTGFDCSGSSGSSCSIRGLACLQGSLGLLIIIWNIHRKHSSAAPTANIKAVCLPLCRWQASLSRKIASPHQTGLGSLVNNNKKRSACSGDVVEGWGRQ